MKARLAVAAIVLTAITGAASAAEAPAAFAACKACHKVEAGANAIGPSLFGVAGAKAGTVAAGFKYSPAMAGWGKSWDDANLAAYLANPKDSIPGNKMVFAGVKDPAAVTAIIEYLKTLK
ncbi:MAG: c-type cytochrome [Magnetospirillum sp.]|nr:c-type cytochrome [Magnetospirillum sp.]